MKIYVSSTSVDLNEYRAVIIESIQRFQEQPIAMVHYNADLRPPVEKCLKDVAGCDMYIGLFAWRYGFIPDGYNQSITELEYRKAEELGIPRLIFVLDDAVLWSPEWMDSNRERIQSLRAELKNKYTVTLFKDKQDLAIQAGPAISVAIKLIEESGVVLPPPPIVEPPPPPPKVFLARLPITGAARFGRDREMKRLDDAWDDGRTNIVTLVALGGSGKSALVNSWLARLAKENFRRARYVFGWSFYNQEADNQEASADVFMAEALEWFGDPHSNRGSPWDKGQRLAELIRCERTLLILDGMEVLQHPPGADEGLLKDKSVQALMQNLAWQNPGLCIISSRLTVADLQAFAGNTAEEIRLEHLDADAGADLLAALGVTGTRTELKQAAQEFQGHALALTLLGRYLVEACDGDVRLRSEMSPDEGDPFKGVIGPYERWLGQGPELAILNLLGLFNGPSHLDALNALRKAPVIPGLTENLLDLPKAKWNSAVNKLRRLSLVAERHPERPDVLDTHPLIRRHFSGRLQEKNSAAWKDANNRLFEYYKALPQTLPDTLNEMVYLFQGVAHGCRAGRYQEAWDGVYWPRIRREEEGYSVLTLGAWGADLVALESFFADRWNAVAALDDTAKARVLTETAFDLRGLGRLEEAVAPQTLGMEIHLSEQRWWSAADAAGNLSELLVTLGDLKQATESAQESIELAEQSGDQELVITNRATLADAQHQSGQFDEAEKHFREAEEMLKQLHPTIEYLHALRGYHFCDLLLGKGSYDEVEARAIASIRVDEQRPHAVALAHLALARMHMLRSQLDSVPEFTRASEYMKKALDELRLAGHQELVVRGSLASTELSRAIGLFDEAEEVLKKAQAAAARGQMRLHLADCCIQYAHLHLATGRLDSARESFVDASHRIQTMGYHRRDAALTLLAAGLSR